MDWYTLPKNLQFAPNKWQEQFFPLDLWMYCIPSLKTYSLPLKIGPQRPKPFPKRKLIFHPLALRVRNVLLVSFRVGRIHISQELEPGRPSKKKLDAWVSPMERRWFPLKVVPTKNNNKNSSRFNWNWWAKRQICLSIKPTTPPQK